MRILQLISGHEPNGAVTHCLDLCRELSRCGHQVVLGQRLKKIDQDRFEGEPVELIDCTFQRWPSRELRRLARLIKDKEIDLVHTHMSSANFFGVLLRWRFGIPCVATAHCFHFQPHWRWNDFVIAVSQAAYRYHHRYNLVPRSKMAVVYAAINTSRFDRTDQQSVSAIRARWKMQPGQFAVGVVGDIVARKGHLQLIRAMPEIVRNDPAAKLIIVGAKDRKECSNVDEAFVQQVNQEAELLRVSDHIFWHGYTRDVPAVMQALDVSVVPSLSEPFGLVAAEAMAAGTPVIASKVGGLAEIIIAEENGLLVPPDRPELLAGQILRLLADPALRQKLGERGRVSVEARFSVQQQLNQVQAIYESVLLKQRFWRSPTNPATAISKRAS